MHDERYRLCDRFGCDNRYVEPAGRPTYPKRYCSRDCYTWDLFGPAQCVGCGVDIPPGFPSKPRRSCGKPDCHSEARAMSKRGRTMPREAIERGRRNLLARNAARNADVVLPERTTCIRPGCSNMLKAGARQYCSRSCHYADRKRRQGHKRAQPYHRCRQCREVFAFDGNGKGIFCSAECSRAGFRGAQRPPEVVEVVALRGFRKSDWESVDMSGGCAGCGSHDRLQRHHVVFEQHVTRAGGDRWDPANAAVLCLPCHADLHGKWSFPLQSLPASAFQFAADLFGSGAAFNYLRRRYAGEDARLDALLERVGRAA